MDFSCTSTKPARYAKCGLLTEVRWRRVRDVQDAGKPADATGTGKQSFVNSIAAWKETNDHDP